MNEKKPMQLGMIGLGRMRYVDGDYNDTATFEALHRELGKAQRPAYYLAIPPAAFAIVVEQLRAGPHRKAFNTRLRSQEHY